MPQGMPPPPSPDEAPPPLPEEPEPKKQRLDDYLLVPEDQFVAQHPGPARIIVSVANVDEGNLKGQVLEITVQSLSKREDCWRDSAACKQTETEWKSWFFEGQFVSCLLQRWWR